MQHLKILIVAMFVMFMTISLNKFEFYEKTEPRKYLTIDFKTFDENGLGDILFEVLALYGIAKRNNRIPFIETSRQFIVEKRLNNTFPGILAKLHKMESNIDERIEIIPFQTTCCSYIKQRFNNSIDFLKLDGMFFQSFKYFDEFRDEIRDLLIPPKKYMEIAQSYMKSEDFESFNICAHIENKDMTDIRHDSTNSTFIIGALNLLIDTYKCEHENISIILIGNDEDFATTEIVSKMEINMKILPKSDPEIYLAFSRKYCDVVLISAPSSTFGWWFGYLSKTGNAVYYQDIKQTNDKIAKIMIQQDFYPNYWIKLKTDQLTAKVRRY
ncbi:unnamed protein product [Caenorhabditis angaria]|uniref:Uncharacterized protein n=1 Tax=Caenorhabditis angaria TaxID=860376 RepID=A0A9P1IFR3_9PELO|nr:unnamed protein product [Caenorhabditis angaria]